ncbi:MAG: bifunctional enoyl-CoA hydratase/phosphate acetyltransferase [Alphaproteobacteria bacterium]|nr:bifunctional enoyl-CoA hydratase/phosphate acetyltransferase [Alphaproteobacteria bacterium]
MTPEFEQKLLSMRPQTPRTVALACATDANALHSLVAAHNMGFVNVILCGDTGEIKSVAEKNNLDVSAFQITQCDDELSAANTAVSLVRNGDAHILMKGQIHTADILRAVLNRETGIRGSGILSHIAVVYSPTFNRTLFMTDIAMVMYPTLEQKVGLIKNAVSFARHMGVKNPRVAPLCAVETLNPAMPATVDAAALHEMNIRGEIADCVISGPIAMDIAVSKTAAQAKGITTPISGDADILLFPNIESGNITIKAMVNLGDWMFGGVILGASAPIVINSRSDSEVSKLFSICCACTM